MAECFLNTANYYRLSAYFLPFRVSGNQYVKGINFNRIISLYKFDSELRVWFFRIIEKIEYYLKTQLSYYLAHKYGSEAYVVESMFSDKHDHKRFMERLTKCKSDNKNTLIVKQSAA